MSIESDIDELTENPSLVQLQYQQLKQQQKSYEKQLKKQQLQKQQFPVYIGKQPKSSSGSSSQLQNIQNKLRSYNLGSEEPYVYNQPPDYVNTNYEYVDEKRTSNSKLYKQYYQQYPQQEYQHQHLKHIENVYKHLRSNPHYPFQNEVATIATNDKIYFESIDENSKSLNHDKFSVNTTHSDLSANLSHHNENMQPKSFLIKQNMNMNMSKIANIKHFNLNNNNLNNMIKSSANLVTTQPLPSSSQQLNEYGLLALNNQIVRQSSSSASLTGLPLVKQLNVNDLYAILKPVIKPHVFDVNIVGCGRPVKLDMYFNGLVPIPYDTLSNASKLNSIRSSVEYFLLQTGMDKHLNYQNVFEEHAETKPKASAHSISLQIYPDRVVIVNKSSRSFPSCLTADSESTARLSYSKNRLGFCGKIKDSCQYLALVIVPDCHPANTSTNTSMNSSASAEPKQKKLPNESNADTIDSCCLIFQYLSNLSNIGIDVVLNEISFIYRNQDSVFNVTTKSEADNSVKTAETNSFTAKIPHTRSPNMQLNYANMVQHESVGRSLNNYENLEIIKSNMNYMSLNASNEAQPKLVTAAETTNLNEGLILIKQTNDIYFNKAQVKIT